MKTTLTWLLWLAVIGGVAWYVIHYRRAQAKEHHAAEIRQQQTDASVAAFALKYNAVTNWEAQIPERAFTIDISSALIQTNGRPVVLVMDLKDVARQGDTYVARFNQFYLFSELYLELKCSKDQAEQLLQTQETSFTPCVLLARISEVSRPRFEVIGTVNGGDENGPITGVELNYSRAGFHAKGVCVALLRKGEIE